MIDLYRILKIPWESQEFRASVAVDWTYDLRIRTDAPPLKPIQNFALSELHKQPPGVGIFGAIGVGHGKTLLSFLFGSVVDVSHTCVVVPPDKRRDTEREYVYWSKYYKFKKPLILAYTDLSNPKNYDLLQKSNVELVVLDEAHFLKHDTSTRTRRVLEMAKRNPSLRFVAMTGTPFNKNFKELSHLLWLTLRDMSPIPFQRQWLRDWSSILDLKGEPSAKSIQSVSRLIDAYLPQIDVSPHVDSVEALSKEILMARIWNTQGVVRTNTQSTKKGLSIIKNTSVKFPSVCEDALKEFRETWVTPSGEVVADAIHAASVIRHMSVGFYYRWAWPNGVVDDEWVNAKNTLNSLLRKECLYHSKTGYDSPFLVYTAVKKGIVSRAVILDAIRMWEHVKDRPAPPIEVYWISTEYLESFLEKIKGPERCIYWYKSKAVGEFLKKHGCQVLGAGSDTPNPKIKSPVLSLNVHIKGKHLPHWHKQWLIEPVTNAADWEQLLGRTHRYGQTDDVICYYPINSKVFEKDFEESLKGAEHIFSTTKQPQKLLLADIYNE